LKLRAARAGAYNYQAKVWNGGIKLPSKMKFDGVLVDAPCSSLGTWQRNPHDRWTATLQDVRELAALQKQILSNVAGAVKPGGKVFYSVCTLTRSETNEVADAFEKSHPRLERLALHNPLDGELYPEGKMALWPQSTGGNGMFVAAWKLRE
jgi:16S rRNA (cytosine967-C5)-methyltransferase